MTVPSKGFLTAFGSITYYYASAEFGIRSTLAGILDIHPLDALVLTEPYTAHSLGNVAKSIVKDSLLDDKIKGDFIALIGEFKSHGPLRNAIGHCLWTKGKRRYSIKPVAFDIRAGHTRLVGMYDDERDWRISELHAEGVKLHDLNRKIVAFQRESGLRAIIERNEAETIAAIEARLGSPTKSS